MKSKPAAVLILLVVLGLLLPAQALAQFTAFPGDGDFEDELVVGGVPAPTAIDWLPTGALLITTQGGVLYRQNGTGAAQSLLDLSGSVCSAGEMGLLGLAVDPAFSTNPFIYLYYTHKKGGNCDAANRANRVSRFTIDGNGVPVGETVLIDNIAAPGSNHNAGDLQFDRNELLYISVGDGGSTPDTARRLNTLNGKILRIDRNGGIPAGNPVQGPGTARCASTGGTPSQVQDATPGDKDEKKKKGRRKTAREVRTSTKGATRRSIRNSNVASSVVRTGKIRIRYKDLAQDRAQIAKRSMLLDSATRSGLRSIRTTRPALSSSSSTTSAAALGKRLTRAHQVLITAGAFARGHASKGAPRTARNPRGSPSRSMPTSTNQGAGRSPAARSFQRRVRPGRLHYAVITCLPIWPAA